MLFDQLPLIDTPREFKVDQNGKLYSVPVGTIIIHGAILSPAPCMCVVTEEVRTERGPRTLQPYWRACPTALCEIPGHEHG